MDELTYVTPTPTHSKQILAFRSAFLKRNEKIPGAAMLYRYPKAEDWIAYIKQRMDQRHSRIYLVIRERDQKMVGVVDLRTSPEHAGYVNDGFISCSVCPGERRKGYGAEIVRKAFDVYRSWGLTQLVLSCWADNEPACRMIELCGGIYTATKQDRQDPKPLKQYTVVLTEEGS